MYASTANLGLRAHNTHTVVAHHSERWRVGEPHPSSRGCTRIDARSKPIVYARGRSQVGAVNNTAITSEHKSTRKKSARGITS